MANASAPGTTVSDPAPPSESAGRGTLLSREWLPAHGLGGYASGTACGVATRRYHGLLVAALPAPLGRTMMLNQLSERIEPPGGNAVAVGVEGPQRDGSPAASRLADFRLESGLPTWRYKAEGLTLEKRVVVTHLQNTSYVSYRLVEGPGPVQLILRPAVHFRGHDAPVDAPHPGGYRLSAQGDQYEIAVEGLPPLRLHLGGPEAAFTL